MARKHREAKELNEIEIWEIAQTECRGIGFTALDIKSLPHEDDYYLKYVIGYNENKEEYGVWMLNLEMGGLHFGHYFNHWFSTPKEVAYNMAVNDFNER